MQRLLTFSSIHRETAIGHFLSVANDGYADLRALLPRSHSALVSSNLLRTATTTEAERHAPRRSSVGRVPSLFEGVLPVASISDAAALPLTLAKCFELGPHDHS